MRTIFVRYCLKNKMVFGGNVMNAAKKIKSLLCGEKYEFAIVLFFYLAGTAVYFLLGNFSKAIYIYMDEVFYYDMARGIFRGNGFAINNFMPNFEKIAYPLVLAPLFAIKDGVLRVAVMTLLNSALILSSVFPAWLISRELGVSRKGRLIVLAITVFYPDMMYSVTFMSENMYLPVCLWTVYIWLRSFKTPRIGYSVAFAVLAYIAYLCKEIALAFPLTAIGFELIFPVVDHLLGGNPERKRLRERYHVKRIAYSIMSAALFFLLSETAERTIFAGVFSSYQLGHNSALLGSADTWLFIVESVLFYFAMVALAAFIIPVVYPLVKYRSLDRSSRGLFLFMLFMCFVITAALDYTVALSEDIYKPAVRSLLRYYSPQILVIFVVFFRCLDKISFDNGRRRTWIVLLVATLYTCLNYSGLYCGSVVDQAMLNWYKEIRTPLIVSGVPDNIAHIYINIMIFALVVLMNYLAFRKPQRCSEIFAVLLISVFVVDNASGYSEKKSSYIVSEEKISESLAVNEYFSRFPDDRSILFIDTQGFPMARARCMDTYFDYDKNLYFAEDSFIEDIEPGGSVPFSDIELKYPTFLRPDFPAESFEYIIVENVNVNMYGKKLSNVELIEEISTPELSVYKNNDIYSISFTEE